MELNDQPLITGWTDKRDGFAARALCTIDGYAAEIYLEVDSEQQRRNDFGIKFWDPKVLCWTHVYRLGNDDVGHVPLPIVTNTDTLIKLNEIASHLWETANLILRASRLRQEELDAAAFLTQQLTLDETRATRYGRLAIPTEIADDPSRLSWPMPHMADGGIVVEDSTGMYPYGIPDPAPESED